jgi:4'-phosphopantetheinyl transferase
LNFSVSHSGGRVVLAFSRGIAVGVDIELIRPKVEIEAIVRRYFSPLEAEPFLSLPAARRTEAFFAVWTRKEAFVKARGEGLTCPLDAFAVTVEPAGPPRLVRAPAGAAAGEWSLGDLDAGPGFRAALAVRHPSPRVSFHRVPDNAFRPIPHINPRRAHRPRALLELTNWDAE